MQLYRNTALVHFNIFLQQCNHQDFLERIYLFKIYLFLYIFIANSVWCVGNITVQINACLNVLSLKLFSSNVEQRFFFFFSYLHYYITSNHNTSFVMMMMNMLVAKIWNAKSSIYLNIYFDYGIKCL